MAMETTIQFGLEEQFLGQIMSDPRSVPEYVIPKIHPIYFRNARNRTIFEIIKSRWPTKMTAIAVIEELQSKDSLELVGGADYIKSLVEDTIEAQDGDALLQMFESRAARGTANALAADIESLAKLHSTSPVALAERVHARYTEFIAGLNGTVCQYKTSEEVHHGFLESRQNNKNPLGFPTGISEVDNLAGGLLKGTLNVLAGLPASGKTCMMLSMMRRQALRHNVRVGFISLEMDSDDVAGRNLMAESHVSFTGVYKGGENDSRVKMAAERLSKKGKDVIFAFNFVYVEDIYLAIWEWRLKLGTQIVYIDHLQQIETKKKLPSYWERIAYIADMLKRCAKETGVVLIVASQFTRSASLPDSKMSDGGYGYVKGGTRIEEVADRVMYLVAPKEGSERADEVQCRIVVVKNRYGKGGTVNLRMDYKHQNVVSKTDLHFQQPGINDGAPPF